MKYYIIAGEASGDLHASNLMKELKTLDGNADFRCWGGDLMKKQGATLVKHINDISFMGFTEVVINLRTIMANFRLCKTDLLQYRPDVLILVDYPGFNLRMARFAHENGIKVFYYISPQIWAWKQSRVHKIKKYVDRMFVILPFEKPFYQRFDYDVDFVGHPLLDALEEYRKSNSASSFRERNSIPEEPIIALLPGSRKMEINQMLEQMLKVIPDFPGYQFIIAGASSAGEKYYSEVNGISAAKLVFGQTYDLLENAEAAIVTSGTATLETALIGVPEVVCYKGSAISYAIARKLIRVKYISLVNLILDRPLVKELIQADMNAEMISIHLKKILGAESEREGILNAYKELRSLLGNSGASAKVAGKMLEALKN